MQSSLNSLKKTTKNELIRLETNTNRLHECVCNRFDQLEEIVYAESDDDDDDDDADDADDADSEHKNDDIVQQEIDNSVCSIISETFVYATCFATIAMVLYNASHPMGVL